MYPVFIQQLLALFVCCVLSQPWVFTYNSWSKNYEYMLKAAVR